MDALTGQRHRGYIQAGLFLRLPYSGSSPVSPASALPAGNCQESRPSATRRRTSNTRPLVDDDGSGDGLLLDFVRRENCGRC
ncbi:hypothetical protein SSAG_02606 [Streptomyces sp. Mg1]|nr:hypothetical protein SSAG_02606 [Streptomyces sp. Mg1]